MRLHKGSSDIVSIMQSTYYSMDGPIKGRIGRFLLDAEQTGNVDLVFDYMKESVENGDSKKIIYLSSLHRFGRKQGLEIYDRLKPVLYQQA